MSVVPDAGKRLPLSLLNWLRKLAPVAGIGLEERRRLEVENLPFFPSVE